jgi:hypothetical protein
MQHDETKIDEAVLALLFLTSFGDSGGVRAWKGQDWGVLGRLHEKGLISDPVGKAKSIRFTEEGWKKSQELFQRLFCKPE